MHELVHCCSIFITVRTFRSSWKCLSHGHNNYTNLHFRRAVVWLLHTVAIFQQQNEVLVIDGGVREPACTSNRELQQCTQSMTLDSLNLKRGSLDNAQMAFIGCYFVTTVTGCIQPVQWHIHRYLYTGSLAKSLV